MAKLKVPSLQHLALNWRSDPIKVKKKLLSLVKNAPTFSYEIIYKLVSDFIMFNQSREQLTECINRSEKREDIHDNFIELLNLVCGHFEKINPSFVSKVGSRFYPIGREIMIPFNPPLIYGVNGKIYFPWFIFWKSNPLTDEQLSLFVTVVDEILNQDPDLEDSIFEILDFSASDKGQPRTLKVINARDIPRISTQRKIEMLETFADGLLLARAEIENMKSVRPENDTSHKNSDQLDLELDK